MTVSPGLNADTLSFPPSSSAKLEMDTCQIGGQGPCPATSLQEPSCQSIRARGEARRGPGTLNPPCASEPRHRILPRKAGGAGCAAPAPRVPGLLLQIVGAGPPLLGPTPQGPWLVVFDLSAGFLPCLGSPCPPLTGRTQGAQPEGLAHATPWSSLQPLSFREGHGAQWPIAAEG